MAISLFNRPRGFHCSAMRLRWPDELILADSEQRFQARAMATTIGSLIFSWGLPTDSKDLWVRQAHDGFRR